MNPKQNASRRCDAERIVAGKSRSTPRPCRNRLFGRSGLVFHVHDLHAAVTLGHRLVRVLELALAIADGHQIGAVDAVFIDQITLDRVGAPLGKVLIVAFATGRIGVFNMGRNMSLKVVVPF